MVGVVGSGWRIRITTKKKERERPPCYKKGAQRIPSDEREGDFHDKMERRARPSSSSSFPSCGINQMTGRGEESESIERVNLERKSGDRDMCGNDTERSLHNDRKASSSS